MSISAVWFCLFIASPVATSSAGEPTLVNKASELLQTILGRIESIQREEDTNWSAFEQWVVDTRASRAKIISEEKSEIAKDNAIIESAEIKIAEAEGIAQQAVHDLGVQDANQKAHAHVFEIETADFTATYDDHTETIAALEEAIEVLQKHQNVDQAPLALLQIQALQKLPEKARSAIVAFLQQQPSGYDVSAPEAYAYEPQAAQTVVSMLQDLLAKFKVEKTDLEKAYMEDRHNHEQMVQTIQDERELSLQNQAQAAQVKSVQGKLLAETQEALRNDQEALKASEAYLADLNTLYAKKQEEHSARLTLQNQEMEALKICIQKIGDFKATKGAFAQQTSAALSQLRSNVPQNAKQSEAAELLSMSARRSNSALLLTVSQQVANDPFVKVKKLIQDLIWKLQQEGTAEVSQKGWCDTELSTNKLSRDKFTREVSKLTTLIESLVARIATLKSEVAEHHADVEALNADVAEATKIREAEKKENDETVAMNEQALEILKETLSILKEFYGPSFVQQSRQTPMEDAPPTWDKPAYEPQFDLAEGAVGIIVSLQTETERELAVTQATEEQQANTHKEFVHQSQLTLASTQKDVEYKTNEVSSKSAALSQAKADLDSAKRELGLANEYFDKLKPDCVNSGITHADRAAAREQEIQSLKEALKILES